MSQYDRFIAPMKSLHFLYHELRPARSEYSYVVPCEEFEAHCELFSRLRVQRSEALIRPEITFDDGYVSDLTLAHPILARHGLRGTFFITAGWTERRVGYMNWRQLRDLQDGGHRIGAHGMTHKLLTECNDSELRNELQDARKRLEDGLGAEVTTMSLPGGRANERVLRACKNAGFEQVFTSRPRAETMAERPWTVGRLNLVSGTTTEWLAHVLDPRSGALDKVERGARWKETAKHLLGDKLYARIWAIANRQEPNEGEAEAAAL